MRVIVAAVGRLKQGAERELAAAYCKRAEAVGRSAGLRQIEIIEIRESRARDPERRRTEESIAIANVLPEGAVIIVFDRAGENIDSPDWPHCCKNAARIIGPRCVLSSAGPTELPRACAAAPGTFWPLVRRLGHISSSASCCWNSFIAPGRFSPAIP